MKKEALKVYVDNDQQVKLVNSDFNEQLLRKTYNRTHKNKEACIQKSFGCEETSEYQDWRRNNKRKIIYKSFPDKELQCLLYWLYREGVETTTDITQIESSSIKFLAKLKKMRSPKIKMLFPAMKPFSKLWDCIQFLVKHEEIIDDVFPSIYRSVSKKYPIYTNIIFRFIDDANSFDVKVDYNLEDDTIRIYTDRLGTLIEDSGFNFIPDAQIIEIIKNKLNFQLQSKVISVKIADKK